MKSLIEKLQFIFDKAPEIALSYFKSWGLDTSKTWETQLDAIKEHSFVIANLADADKLQRILESLEKAMAGEVNNKGEKRAIPYKEWVKEIKETIPNKTNWQTIYRTNMFSSYNSGRYISQVAAAEYVPYWQHNCVMDARTRPLGQSLHGKVYRFDDEHWNTYYPPNEYNDRDMIVAMTQRKLERRGLPIETKPPRNKDTNKEVAPHDSFKSNPSENKWEPDVSKYHPTIQKQLKTAFKDKNINIKTTPFIQHKTEEVPT